MSWMRCIQSGFLSTCRLKTVSRFYTTDVESIMRQKWRVAVPSPRSILEDDDAVIDLTEDNETVNGMRPNTPPLHLRRPPDKPTPHGYKVHRKVIQKSFPDGWSPPRKLSREAMEGLRQLYHFDAEKFSTPVLAEKFRISPEAVRRILKSKWEPSREKRMKLVERERQQRSEFIKLNRLRERIEARNLAELKQNGSGWGKRGIIQDKLTLQ